MGGGGFAAQPGSLVVDPASRARWDRPEKHQAEGRERERERRREAVGGSESKQESQLPHCTNKLQATCAQNLPLTCKEPFFIQY